VGKKTNRSICHLNHACHLNHVTDSGLRHIFCHEVTKKVTIELSEAEQLINDCEALLDAADALCIKILYPGPGLNQSEMNMRASADLNKINNEISFVISDIQNQVTRQRFKEFMSVQKMWEKYRDAYATYLADCYKGGTVWPTMYCNRAIYLSKKRVEELKQYLTELQEFDDVC